MSATAIAPRLTLTVAADLRMACAKRADNPTFMVDVFGLRVEETGAVFTAEVKQYWDALDRPDLFPILGTIRKGVAEIWSYNSDLRVKAGFKGRVQIVAYQGTTYAVFRTTGSKAVVHYVLPLSDLLTQSATVMTPAESGRLKMSIAKALDINNASLTPAEDQATSYSVKVLDHKDGLRLEKVSHVRTGRATYQVVNEAGKLVNGPFGTLIEGRLALGHVPEAPKVAPGGKTNVVRATEGGKKKDGNKKAA